MTRRIKEPASVAMVAFMAVIIVWSALCTPGKPPVRELPPAMVLDSLRRATRPISRFDGIVKECSDSTGFDWRFISAVIYHESRFKTTVVSRRGAVGLMQLMPSTVRKWGAADPADPRQNVQAGTRYLRYLHGFFDGKAASERECLKFTLAAYNAGHVRVEGFMEQASRKGLDSRYWDNVAGAVKAVPAETVRFVKKVMETYNGYCSSVTR